MASSIRQLGDRGLLGMPGPVWTLALWSLGNAVILSLSLLGPMNVAANPTPRAIILGYVLVALAALLLLRARTPSWFIHLQMTVTIVAAWILIYSSVELVGRVTSSLALVAVALYVSFWMRMPVAFGYVIVANAGAFVVLAQAGTMPRLSIPWTLITLLSLGLVAAIGYPVQQLSRQVVTDPLTGLLNRAGLQSLVSNRAHPTRLATPRCVVAMDLDALKAVNDARGHAAGDALLSRFGAGLAGAARAGDIAVRSGGDEFLLVLSRTGLEEATGVVEGLIGRSMIDVSFGITEWTAREDFDQAWMRADRLMYEHKAARSRTRDV